jgi:glycosyltransferase involved in cell wall biosynthesis
MALPRWNDSIKRQNWSIAIYKGDSPFALRPAETSNPVLRAADISDKPIEFVADPFMIKVGQEWHMFFEALIKHTGKGCIGLASSHDGLSWRYRQIVLEEPFHMSYPYVFQWNNDYYMIPETCHANAIRLYKVVDMPTKWRYVGDLLQGYYVDTTISEIDGYLWMFTCSTDTDTLRLFYSKQLLGEWKEHPLSPIIRNNANIARPAGRISRHNGKLYRFTQDTEPYYGMQVRAFEIIKLTETEYEEREAAIILKGSGSTGDWNADGMHHIDAQELDNKEWLACVDGHRFMEKNKYIRKAEQLYYNVKSRFRSFFFRLEVWLTNFYRARPNLLLRRGITPMESVQARKRPLHICMISEEEIVGQQAMIPGGIGQYILRYSKMLAGLGHEVTLLCKSGSPFECSEDGIHLIGLPPKGKLPWDVSVYFWLLARRFDIVEFPEWGGLGAWTAMLLPSWAGHVITRGHGHQLLVQRVHGQPERKGRQHIKEWLQVYFSRGVLANSNFLRREFMKDFGIDSKRVDVCHIGIDPHAIGNTQPVEHTYKGPTLLYVGGMDRRKGPEDLLRIVSEVNKQPQAPRIQLILIGQDTPTGPGGSSYRQHCIDMAHRLGITDQVEFVPAIPRHQLHRYYKRASVFVSASRAESLGIPFLEAMSMGLPVVTWRTGAAPELIEHGRDGLLFELGDVDSFASGLIRLLHDRNDWRRMSANAVDNVTRRFLEKDVLERQVSWYRHIATS